MKSIIATVTLLVSLALTAHAYESIRDDEAELLYDWRGEFSAAEQATLRDWQSQALGTMRLLHGSLPRSPIRIAMQPYRGSGPVPFALVLRDEPQGILFYVDPAASLDALVRDWTAYHEYTHLFIPYPGMRDVWFSEGLASYYQNILQLRAGLLTPAETRAKLRSGFERGAADDANTTITLAQLSAEMRERRAFMRVYWSGALYFLEADVRLRERDDPAGPRSLDDVIRAFNACCMADKKRWRGPDIAAAFDEIVGEPLFVPMFERYASSTALPDYAPWLERPEVDTILSRLPATLPSTGGGSLE